MAGSHHRLRATLCQIKPRKGDVRANVARVRAALPVRSELALFPEAVLSGYFVEGAAHEVALSPADLVAALGPPPAERGCDLALGFYERGRRGVYNSMAYLTPSPRADRYEVLHVHRKIFLPTYGLFEEARFVEPGREVAAFDTRFGRIGMLICEDLWHAITPSILALDGAELILAGCASPARGFGARATRPENLAEWDRIAARTAREHGVFMLVAQLAGSEGGKIFPGGSSAWGPDGSLIERAPLFEEAGAGVAIDFDEILRVRTASPFLADLSTAWPRLRHSLERAWEGSSVERGRKRMAPATGQGGGAIGSGDRVERGTKEDDAPSRRPDAADRRALAIDAPLVEAALIEFIREEVVRRRGFERVVLGVSGGVDSAVSLALAARALGPGNVFGFRLPYATSSPASLAHAALVLGKTGAHQRTIDISAAVDACASACDPAITPERRGNLAARIRAAILFDQSVRLNALPLGTGNKSERLLGYYTWHGDDSPPINPLGDLFKTQVLELARHLEIPPVIVEKPASADLVEGVDDEDELGIGYRRADPILEWLLRGHGVEALARRGFDPDEVGIVWQRLSSTHWKRELATVAILSESSIGVSYLRPVDY